MSRAYADSTLVRVAGPDAFEPALRRFLKACRETGVFTEPVRRRVKSQKAAQRRARASRRRPETGPLEDWKPAPAPRA